MDVRGKKLIYSIVIDVLHSMDDKFILKGKINMHMYPVYGSNAWGKNTNQEMKHHNKNKRPMGHIAHLRK